MVADVGPVEAGDDQSFLRDPELGEDVGAGPRVGGRGQRQPRHVGMVVEQWAQLAIVGAEVVAPFADAMRLVDRDQRQPRMLGQLAEPFGRRAFGSDIEQVELAGAEPLDRRLAVAVRRGQRSGADPDRLGRADLVVHQRDQRRDHQRGAVADQRRELVAQRLARAGRHHRKRGLARDHSRDDLLLNAAKRVEAERAFENLLDCHSAASAVACSERSAACRAQSSA